MSNTQKLTIIAINSRTGVSAKTGRPYSMHEAQCILTEGVADATGVMSEQIKVGRVNVADELKDTIPGDYVADFKLFVSRDGELVARIVGLKAMTVSRPAPPAPEKKAA
ncbi:hypothetical protein ACI2S5_00500 [Ralstonia nicotianae]